MNKQSPYASTTGSAVIASAARSLGNEVVADLGHSPAAMAVVGPLVTSRAAGRSAEGPSL